jgi:hypothetical protein
LAALGLAGIAVIFLMANESAFAHWFLPQAFAPERILPLIGLGVACGLVGKQVLRASILLFGIGIAVGFVAQDWLIKLLYNLFEGPIHLFLTGPISFLAIGLALIPGAHFLPWLLPVAAVVAGAMLALAIFLTDPSLHDPLFIWTPLLAACWVVATVSLTLRAFRRSWFAIFGRILGSWLVAIGLLYGGASLLPVLNPPPPPADTSQESTRGAELNRAIRGLHAPDQPTPFPGASREPYRQP